MIPDVRIKIQAPTYIILRALDNFMSLKQIRKTKIDFKILRQCSKLKAGDVNIERLK